MTFEGLLRHGIEVDEEMMDSMLGVSQTQPFSAWFS